MKKNLKTFKWWWSWTPDVVEKYLENMASQGWELVSVGFGMVVFYFRKSKPKKIRYCVEYNPDLKPDYHILLEDDGWQLMGQQAGWILWEKPYNTKRPEIFTETGSLIERNNKLLKLLYLLLSFQLINLSIQFNSFQITTNSNHFGNITLTLIILLIAVSSLMVMAIYKINNHNKQLRNK